MRQLPEDLAELLHESVNQQLALLLCVTHGKALVCMPVPGVAAPPLQSGSFYMRLCNLPPSAHFASVQQLLLHHGLIPFVDQCVVLQEPCPLETPLVYGIGLGLCRLVEHLGRDGLASRLYVAHEVNEVHDARNVLPPRCCCTHHT